MMDIAMMAGCASASKVQNENAKEKQEVVLNEDGVALYAPKEVLVFNPDFDYGRVEHSAYYSKVAEKNKNIKVLLPPGYTAERKYPVLYVLHGIFGDENSMVGTPQGGVHGLLMNMMNQKLCEEMIVVFPFMYTSKTQIQCNAIDEKNVACYDNFIDELTSSIMPYISEKYSVLEGRDNTAITGFSMGGREALACAFYRPDLFKFAGAICPAPGLTPGRDVNLAHKGQFQESELKFDSVKPDLIMLCGGDCDSVVGTFPLSYHQIMEKNGTDHIWWLVPGSDHGDPAISSGIYNLALRLFK